MFSVSFIPRSYTILSGHTSERAKMDSKVLLNILLTVCRNKEIVSKDFCEGCRDGGRQLFSKVQLSLCVSNCI